MTALAVAALAASPRPAMAQEVGDPLRLGPPPSEERESQEEDRDGEGRPRTPDTGSDESVEGIQTDRLAAMGPDGIGVLDPGGRGLGMDIWEGTSRRVVLEMLPRIPADLTSPALRSLARRLLLSATRPPERRQAQGARGSLLQLRLDRLAAMGEIDGLRQMLDAVPRTQEAEELRRLRAETDFLMSDFDAACSSVRAAIAESGAPFWQRALAVCQLADGANAEANLTLSLLRETGAEVDAGFRALFDAVERGAERMPDVPEAGPLHVALLGLGGRPVPDGLAAKAAPRVLLALARQESAGAEPRARAAERAASLGLIDGAALGDYYGRLAFDAERVRTAVNLVAEQDTDGLSPLRKRALLLQAAQQEPAPAVVAELASEALESAGASLYLPTARLYAPLLTEVEASPDLTWFAAAAGRALYAARRADAAARWLTMARQEAIINPEAAMAVTALWPYARLSRDSEVPLNEGLAAWRSAQSGNGLETLAYRESLLRAAFEALDRPESRRWIDIAASDHRENGPVASAALVYALEEAGNEGRRGEAVMLALIALGGTGLEDCHPLVFGKALTALRQVGLEDDAQALALEAAVRNGV